MATRKKFGTDLPTKVVEDFSAFAEDHKLVKAKAAACAFQLVQRLPLRLFNAVIRERWPLVDEALRQAEHHLAEQDAEAELAILEAKAGLPGCKETRSGRKGAAR